jgi:hypothetical protein
MSPELEAQLKSRYPALFRDLHNPAVTMADSGLYWGIQCPDEWHGALDELCAAITAIDPEGRVVARQVKEKCGELRFYVAGGNDDVHALIWDAVARLADGPQLPGSDCTRDSDS